jgi:hypothetical protein
VSDRGRGGDSVEALRKIWMEGYERGLRVCGVRFSYNNGSANAMDGHHNVTVRCNLDAGHAGDHDRCQVEPPAAHPPEGSREPQKWPWRVAKGTQCSSEMCEPPTPPPGPGQDVEAQARALVIQFEALPHCEHPDWAMLQCFDCWVKFWAAALRAAQAEAERRAQEAEHGIARWEVYAQGLEAQVRSVREALVGVRRDGGPLNACWCPRLVRQAEQPQPHTPDCIKATRALSSSPVSSQSEPKA